MVPTEIAGVDKTALSLNGKLSDWVDIVVDNTTKMFEIQVKHQHTFFTLSSEMSFGEYVNIINGVAHTYRGATTSFKGVMGLSQQTTSDLFLSDGMYSLWSRDPVDPQTTLKNPDQNAYNTHPFIFGKE